MVWCKLVLNESIVARDNYSYNKYQKELARKKKNEEKRQSRLDKKNIQAKAHLALLDGKCALSAQAPGLIGMPSAPLSASDAEQASNGNATAA